MRAMSKNLNPKKWSEISKKENQEKDIKIAENQKNMIKMRHKLN
jgi:nitrogen regulatory protein PII-like uncharacterized protein